LPNSVDHFAKLCGSCGFMFVSKLSSVKKRQLKAKSWWGAQLC